MRAAALRFGSERSFWVLGIVIAALAAVSLSVWVETDTDLVRLTGRASMSPSGLRRPSQSLAAKTEAVSIAPSQEPASYLSPEVLNSHVIFSRRCSNIIYSSNRNGLLRPFVIDMTNPAQPGVSAIEINESRDFVAQSLAPDCRTLAMVSDRNGNGSFEIYLYDLRQRTLQSITSRPELDEGKPVFAPHGRILAYLSGSHLSLYDYAKSAHLEVTSTSERFESVTWSESGASLYLEDEWTNIWQYDLQPRQFRKIWNAPRMSYSPRTISQRHKHLLFASNHESDYSQIYQLDLERGSLKRLYSSSNDQHSPLEVNPGHYTFRTIVDASFIATELRNGKYRTLSPPLGVSYDFSLEFGAPLLLYSNDRLPISLYWINEDKLTPLLRMNYSSRQPNAIPIKNASGMTNFLYLPSKAPRAWLIWLHGGPHEQVSPRFNLYFDSLSRRNIAVYAINYPGSTGLGNSYALSGKSEQESIQVQLPAIERDIEQLRQLHPEISSFMLVGVSYGSILAHLLVAKHPEVTRFVDFSGIADSSRITSVGSSNRFYSPMLVIYGENDFALRNPARSDLISRYEGHARVSRLVLPNEGHFIQRRGDIDQILRRLEAFLAPPVAPKDVAVGVIRQHP
jgi:pimeloyl-ACP methyl ester carboxylesterase